jgi:hypothetical protein
VAAAGAWLACQAESAQLNSKIELATKSVRILINVLHSEVSQLGTAEYSGCTW